MDLSSLTIGFLGGAALTGLALGAVIQKRERRLHEAEFITRQLEDIKAWKEEHEKQLVEQFDAISQKTLKTVRDELEQKHEKAFKDQKEVLNTNITLLLKPLTEMVETGHKKVKEFGDMTLAQTSGLQKQIEMTAKQTQELIQAKNTLVDALKGSKGRGDWGELELVRLLEESGLQQGIHYEYQHVQDNQSRPDIKIKLPNNNILYIDAKTLLVNLEAMETALTEEDTREARKKQTDSLKKEIMKLHSRDYQQEGMTVDFVILYVPRESMLRVPLEEEPTLIQDAAKNGVILASPLILMAVLKTVAQGWQQSQLTEKAHEIQRMGRELHKRAAIFLEKFDNIGKKIEALSGQYEETRISFTGNKGFVKQLQKFEEYGSKSARSLPPRYQVLDADTELEILEELGEQPAECLIKTGVGD